MKIENYDSARFVCAYTSKPTCNRVLLALFILTNPIHLNIDSTFRRRKLQKLAKLLLDLSDVFSLFPWINISFQTLYL